MALGNRRSPIYFKNGASYAEGRRLQLVTEVGVAGQPTSRSLVGELLPVQSAHAQTAHRRFSGLVAQLRMRVLPTAGRTHSKAATRDKFCPVRAFVLLVRYVHLGGGLSPATRVDTGDWLHI